MNTPTDLEGPQKMKTSELMFNGGRQKLRVKWGQFQPKHLYLVWVEKSVTTKICLHWIMDICNTTALPVQFLSHPCVYYVMVCGLNSVKAGLEEYYEMSGIAKLTISDARESMETDLELMDTPWEEDVDTQFTTKESFMLNIKYSPPSTHKLHHLPQQDLNQFYLIHVHQELPRKDLLFLHLTSKRNDYTFPVNFVPASDYVVTVFVPTKITQYGISTNCLFHETCSVSKPLHFRAYMTKQEITELLYKGESYARRQNPNSVEINYLYRNKWDAYYENVLYKNNGIMHCYDKDCSGDKASILHRNVKGIFFGANINFRTGVPPNSSFYGPMRLNVPAIYFLSRDKNLYFADFYCHYTNHKVTLVVTVKGTDCDQWCNSRLVQMNQFQNPFLSTFDGKVYITTGLTVEVFYTESIDLGLLLWHGGAFFTFVQPIGYAHSIVRGVPKNPNCDICKLNHRKTKDKQNQGRIQNSSTPSVDQLAVSLSSTPIVAQTSVSVSSTLTVDQLAISVSSMPSVDQIANSVSSTPSVDQIAVSVSSIQTMDQKAVSVMLLSLQNKQTP